MPNLELGPNSYRKQDLRTGRWHLPDDPKLARWGFLAAAAILIYIFSVRGQLESWTLFGCTAMFAFAGGILFAVSLKNRY